MSHLESTLLPYETVDINEPSVVEAQKKINESAESRRKCLEMLRNSLKEIKEIEPYLEEEFLLRFIRVAKFDPANAFQRVLKYFQQQEVLLDAFKKCSLSLQRARNLNHIWISPYRLPNNSFLLIFLGNVDYSKYTFAERFYVEILALNKALENAVNQICGITIIIDYEGFDLRALLAYKPSNCRLFLESTLNGLPLQVKAVHIVNAPAIFSFVFKIGLAFISKKIQSRIFNHPNNGSWKNLHTLIPTDVLPENYGGKVRQQSLINGLDDIEKLEEDFRIIFNYGYRETKQCRNSMDVLCLRK